MEEKFNLYKYAEKFNTKEEIKNELARLREESKKVPRNVLNVGLWQRVRVLNDKFNAEFCTKIYYMDELGRTHWYYKEI